MQNTKTHPSPSEQTNQRIDWIRLARTNGVSRSTLLKLVDIFGNIEAAIQNVAKYSIKGGRTKPIEVNSHQAAIQELENCHKIGAQIICFNEDKFPQLLKEISDPPALITTRGNIDLISKNIVSIVGPRNASINGCKFAQKIAYELGSKGITIASGLARGVDTYAHEASLKTGTIGVIAGGINNIYPKENAKLYQSIINEGLLICEAPFGSPPRGGNFPQRNRIISGLSLGVVVVEATLRSGTLITARFALEQNREIFAVPGSPFDPRYEGTNRLIKQGAKLIENSNDVLEDIQEIIASKARYLKINESFEKELTGFPQQNPDDNIIDEARKLILEKINYSPTSVQIIINELEIPVKIANIVFVQLELADRINYQNGMISLKN
jgi:DNA processing protein